jgi:hypothetical protein
MTRHRRRRPPRSARDAALVLVLALPLLATDAAPRPAEPPVQPTVAAAPVADVTPPPAPAPPPLRRGLAQAAVDAAEEEASDATELAVAVFDRGTGELAVGEHGNEPYYTASLSKLVVVVDILDRRRLEGLAVSDADVALIRRALGPSDDDAMSALWDRFDGAGAAARVSARLGLQGTSAPRRTGQWGEVEVTAADFVRIWQHVLDEMPADERDLLVADLEAAPPVADDGFDQAYGLLAPAVRGSDGPGPVAKQGWMCCFSGQYYIHSAGAVGDDRRFVVTLLTRVPRAPGWAAARKELTDIATAATAAFDADEEDGSGTSPP